MRYARASDPARNSTWDHCSPPPIHSAVWTDVSVVCFVAHPKSALKIINSKKIATGEKYKLTCAVAVPNCTGQIGHICMYHLSESFADFLCQLMHKHQPATSSHESAHKLYEPCSPSPWRAVRIPRGMQSCHSWTHVDHRCIFVPAAKCAGVCLKILPIRCQSARWTATTQHNPNIGTSFHVSPITFARLPITDLRMANSSTCARPVDHQICQLAKISNLHQCGLLGSKSSCDGFC